MKHYRTIIGIAVLTAVLCIGMVIAGNIMGVHDDLGYNSIVEQTKE
ncbi:MAG: hypothetical protein RR626_09290 [Anaerovoracaceae bacterium]